MDGEDMLCLHKLKRAGWQSQFQIKQISEQGKVVIIHDKKGHYILIEVNSPRRCNDINMYV